MKARREGGQELADVQLRNQGVGDFEQQRLARAFPLGDVRGDSGHIARSSIAVADRKLDREIGARPVRVRRHFFELDRFFRFENLPVIGAEALRCFLGKQIIVRLSD